MAATLDRTRVIDQLREVFDRVTDGRLACSTIQEEAHITQDLGLSSLELLEFRFELESVWNVNVNDEQARGLQTVRDVVTLIVDQAS
jgi:acyl carrier protein